LIFLLENTPVPRLLATRVDRQTVISCSEVGPMEKRIRGTVIRAIAYNHASMHLAVTPCRATAESSIVSRIRHRSAADSSGRQSLRVHQLDAWLVAVMHLAALRDVGRRDRVGGGFADPGPCRPGGTSLRPAA
jgi:hypothetical protein